MEIETFGRRNFQPLEKMASDVTMACDFMGFFVSACAGSGSRPVRGSWTLIAAAVVGCVRLSFLGLKRPRGGEEEEEGRDASGSVDWKSAKLVPRALFQPR